MAAGYSGSVSRISFAVWTPLRLYRLRSTDGPSFRPIFSKGTRASAKSYIRTFQYLRSILVDRRDAYVYGLDIEVLTCFESPGNGVEDLNRSGPLTGAKSVAVQTNDVQDDEVDIGSVRRQTHCIAPEDGHLCFASNDCCGTVVHDRHDLFAEDSVIWRRRHICSKDLQLAM